VGAALWLGLPLAGRQSYRNTRNSLRHAKWGLPLQSSFAVVNAAMRKQRAERIGLLDYHWPDTLRNWTQEGYPVDEKGNPREPVEVFHFDLARIAVSLDSLPLRGQSELLAETEEWTIKRDGAGAAFKYWKHKSGTPEHIDFRMTSREVWERDYRPHLLNLDRERLNIAAAKEALAKRRQQGFWTFYTVGFIWETLRHNLGDKCMLESLLLDPAWIHDFNRVYTDFYISHYKLLLEEVGKPDGVWVCEDLGYKNGLFCSPRTLEQLVFPYFKELVDFFHSYDLPVVLHCDGRIEAALPLIVEAGFDGLNPMEVKAGCDVVRFARKYGDKLSFVGGLDVRILESGNRGLMKHEIENLIEAMKDTGAGYVFGSDHSITTNVSYADYQYALEVYRKRMIY